MTIFYVRHGETVWNRALRLQGRADSPLTVRGVQLALAYADRLRDVLPTDGVGFYSSPLGRARQTAALLADALGFAPEDVIEDTRLAEQHVGAFEGLAWAQIEAEFGHPAAHWKAWDARPPDGESRHEMLDRACRWLAEPRPPVAVVVSHGGLSRVFRGAFLGLGPDAIATLPPHDHGRLYHLRDGRCEEILAEAGDPIVEAALG